MDPSRHIVLIGPMGAGKSTIGKRLARDLGRPFIDSDQVIRERTGVEIARIFDVEGEAGFRQREKDVIADLLNEPPCVLATGGGAVLDADTRTRLWDQGIVVYLETSVAEQLRRTGKDKRRPLLQTENPQERLEALMAERQPLYETTAHVTVSTDRGSIGQMVHRIVTALEDHPG